MSTLIVGALVFGLIAAAVWKIIRDRRSGAACGCGCGGCDKTCGSKARERED
jgi:hypothetical protein